MNISGHLPQLETFLDFLPFKLFDNASQECPFDFIEVLIKTQKRVKNKNDVKNKEKLLASLASPSFPIKFIFLCSLATTLGKWTVRYVHETDEIPMQLYWS